jgi:hypothetical protein
MLPSDPVRWLVRRGSKPGSHRIEPQCRQPQEKNESGLTAKPDPFWAKPLVVTYLGY